MVSFVQFIAIAASITIACGQGLYVNNSPRDYYDLARRELFHQIEIEENEIASVGARYADRLDTIQLQQEQLLLEVQQMTTYDKTKLQLKYCSDAAKMAAASLTLISQSNVKSAQYYVDNQLPMLVNQCDLKFPKNQPALEKCYLDCVAKANDTVHNYLDTSHNELDQSLYKASVAANNAVQCSFKVEKDVLEKIGQTDKLISDCEKTLNK